MMYSENPRIARIYSVIKGNVETEVDELIKRSWSRCALDFELDPVHPPEPTIIVAGDLRERQEKLKRLLDIARTEMTGLYQQLDGSGFAIMLTDTDGVVLNYVGDPSFTDIATRTGLRAGAIWTEREQGTNGMGTCLIEQKPLVIHHQDHFLERNVGVTCSAAPVFGPDGELMAVLDASAESTMAQQHTMVLVNMSAQMIENRVFLCAFKDRFVLRFHSRPEFVSTLGEGAVAFDADGRVVGANRSALVQFGMRQASEMTGSRVDDLFNTSFGALVNKAARSALHPIPIHDARAGRRFFAVVQLPEGQPAPSAAPAACQVGAINRPALAEPEPRLREGLEFGDPQMARNVEYALRVVGRDIPIILAGETGTGKGLFAKALHLAGPRAQKPFVAINCASIPETLIESELFGYRAGAFTGASRDGSRGKIVQANGGTLFLDEIGDMPLSLQARLLRVLEEREVVPLGGENPVRVDINIISATHQELPSLVDEGRFREDLYYRLKGITLTLPALRERQDKAALIRHVLQLEHDGSGGSIGVDDEAMALLLRHPWPGNIRQLRNSLRTVIALRSGNTIGVADIPEEIRRGTCGRDEEGDEHGDGGITNPLETAERDALLAELEVSRWNITNVARKLDMSRNTLYRKMKRYGLRPPR